jgi:hypothetical protein
MMIRDDQRLLGAYGRHGDGIPTSDDGFGGLWVYYDSMGVAGVVRARTWEDAYEAVEDDILQPIAEDEVHEAYGFEGEGAEDRFRRALAEDPDPLQLEENFTYQSNATGTGIVQHDPNGDNLEAMTPELRERLGITLVFDEE